MTDYQAVEREMAAGTPLDLICTACPWDRLCVNPPTMTPEEVERQMSEAESKDARSAEPGRMPVALLLTAIALGGRDKSGQLCPVFAARLRTNRDVADGVRALMRSYQD